MPRSSQSVFRILAILTLAISLVTPAAVLGHQSPAATPPASDAGPGATTTPVADRAGDTDPALYEAILPQQRERIYQETAGLLTRYRIEAELQPGPVGDPATVSGTVNLRYVNEFDSPQDEINFRLYPNDPAYGEAEMRVEPITAHGAAVEAMLSVSDTVLSLALPEPLAPEEAVDIEIAYSAVIPIRPARTYGIFATEPDSGTVSLAHWFPILAGVDDNGWSLEPVSRNGDPIFSNTALYDVHLTTPTDMVVAATGVEIGRRDDPETITRRFVSGPSRDFTVVASTTLETASREVNGTTITSYYRPGSEAGGEEVIDFTERALNLFSSLLTPYPYRELDVVEVELYGAAGVEFPQLVFLAHSIYDGNVRNEHYLEFVTAHEVAHQWLYGLIGNNQHHAAFIDEGLSEYLSSAVYFSTVYGPETGRRQYALEVLHWYLSYLQSGNDLMVAQPTDDFTSVASYSVIVYAKGAIGFAQLRELIGDEAFFAALKSYATRFEFKIATPAGLRTAFAESSNQDVDSLWNAWFESAVGAEFFTPEDYQELLVELGLR